MSIDNKGLGAAQGVASLAPIVSNDTPSAAASEKGALHPAIENLKAEQRQLDFDGVEVGVSRQALEETLEIVAELLAELTNTATNLRRLSSHLSGHGLPGLARAASTGAADCEAVIAKATGASQ